MTILKMGEYGIYVWPAYFFTFLIFFINVFTTLRERNKVKKILRRYFRKSHE